MSTSFTVSASSSAAEGSSLFASVSSAFASFFPTVHADDEKDDEESKEGDDSEGGEEEGGDEEEEEEEEDEPEDAYPAIYEECENSKKCSAAKHHFDDCQTRVTEGKGFKDENCVEEFFHLAHCASECAAPRLFSKLV